MNYIAYAGLGTTEGKQIARYILNEACKYWGVPIERVLNKRKKQESVDIRHICMYLIRKYSNLSYLDVGKCVGGYGHSNTFLSIRKVEDYTRFLPEYRAKLNEFENKLSAITLLVKDSRVYPTILSVKNLDKRTIKYRLKKL